jgi:hypothetical protein
LTVTVEVSQNAEDDGGPDLAVFDGSDEEERSEGCSGDVGDQQRLLPGNFVDDEI